MTTTTPAPVRRLSSAEIRRRYPAGGLQLLDALTAAEDLDQAIEAAKAAPGVHLTDLRPFLEFATHAGPLRSIHSHDGGIRSSAYGVRTADGLEALRLVAWFEIGPDRERDLTWRRTICDECRREYIATDAIAIIAAAAAQREAGRP